MAKRFSGKVVIVTGASAGVGASVARQFADEGARLVLAARGQEALDQIAGEISADVLTVQMNVADHAACQSLLQQARGRFGAVNVLVNNAGCNYRGPAASFEAEQLAQIVDVNLRAPVVLSRLAIPFLHEAGGGSIVNVASIAGKIPVPEEATYSATKFGLRAFSRALAEELTGSGIAVSCVSPGPIDTGFIMDDIDKVPDYFFSQPISSAEQVAKLVIECAADGKVERTIPFSTGKLATLGYLLPGLANILRPVLARKGRRIKAEYQKKYG
ncbi:MAG: SDR family NAD(P)-dependent oxidoreductase [Gammaproteobacteria bacterium]|nr:SDR family NAD(P)-dependent oxidoreductase [Gammaproteobacteria bacterium]